MKSTCRVFILLFKARTTSPAPHPPLPPSRRTSFVNGPQVKSETSKAKWLMEIATKPDLKVNLDLFSAIVGVQKGNNSGKDLIFMLKPHISRVIEVNSPFYKEAQKSVSTFQRKKGIPYVRAWDEENIFYNPLIIGKSGKTITETVYFRENGVCKLGQLLDEKSKEARNLPFDKKLIALANNITLRHRSKK